MANEAANLKITPHACHTGPSFVAKRISPCLAPSYIVYQARSGSIEVTDTGTGIPAQSLKVRRHCRDLELLTRMAHDADFTTASQVPGGTLDIEFYRTSL